MQPPRLLTLVIAHAAAGAAVVGASMALLVVVYVAAIAWTVVADEPMGGPLFLPFGLVLVAVASAASVVLVCAPVTMATAVLCRRVRRWPRVAELPVAFALGGAEVVLTAIVVGALRGADLRAALEVGVVGAVAVCIALALYWSVVQALDAGGGVLVGAWRRWREHRTRAPGRPRPV